MYFSANLALLQPAYQSSDFIFLGNHLKASFDVDGNFNPALSSCSCCAMTNDGSGGPNWLVVDLGSPAIIEWVALTCRTGGFGT